MSRFVRLCLTVFALILAPVLLLQGMGNIPQPLGPARSLNGYWLADIAISRLQFAQMEGGVAMELGEGGAMLARQAFAREPLATNALFVFAVETRGQGDTASMQQILDASDDLDKRNRNIGALRLEQAALSGDISQAFDVVDRLATTHPALTGEFVRPLVSALEEEDSIPLLRDALEQEPVWAEAFWTAVPAEGARVLRMYGLRQQTDVGANPDSDAQLLYALAGNGLYEEAFAFWGRISGSDPQGIGFVDGSDFPPFGWQLTSTGERAMSARGEGQYSLYVQNETEGELARQLVRLDPGLYQFGANVEPASEQENVLVSLECATVSENERDVRPLTGPVTWQVSDECGTYWLVLSGRAWDRRAPLRAQLSDLQLQAGS